MNTKPHRPYKDFPLFPHNNGQWAKKIRGQLRYFGVWSKPHEAVSLYEFQREALQAGRTPPVASDRSKTVGEIVDAFLKAKKSLLESGDLAFVTYANYHVSCSRITEVLGKERSVTSLTTEDFNCLRESLAKRFGPTTLACDINRIRSVFKYAYESGLLEKPIRFGPNFKRPSARALRLARFERGPRLFTAIEIRKLLKVSSPTMRAMILLGINAGLGNSDIARLKHSHIKGTWLNYPRPKTGMPRRAKLWPQTIAAIRWLPKRDSKHPDKQLVFTTRLGNHWLGGSTTANPIANEFTKVLRAADLRRPGLSFYALRHTFQTIAEGCGDMPAVKHIMGHVPPRNDMSSVYREEMSDSRLVVATDHVKEWLFNTKRCRQRVSSRKTGTNSR